MLLQLRHCPIAIVAITALCTPLFVICAKAQTADYFATPWIVAPVSPQTGTQNEPNSSGNVAIASGLNATIGVNSRSGLYTQALASSEPSAPPIVFSFNTGIDEIATDNVAETQNDRRADLGSLFSTGAILSADSERVSGILAATGLYRRQINDTALDGFSGYGYANGGAVLIPGMFYFSVHGLMDNISRAGGGLQSTLVQTPQETQVYSISGSPILSNRVGDIGINVARYQIGQAWFSNNTGAIQEPGLNIGPISSSTNQTAREDFKMTGSIFARLMSDVSLSRTENDGGAGSGIYTNLDGELINEYEVTRYASAIGAAGYQQLRDNDFPNIDGEGPVWDVGTRLRPNADSYVLLTYGHHDLKSDFAGELWWQVTDLTNIYAAYTDSITNSQQSVIGNVSASQLGPDGASSGVTFSQSTLIGTLDDPALNAGPGQASAGSPLGVPLADLNNTLPLQDGLFREKTFGSTGRTTLDQDSLSLTLYRTQSTQLTGSGVFGNQVGHVDTVTGGVFSWQRPFSPALTGSASAGYSHSDSGNADIYNTALGLSHALSRSLTIVLRYDLIYHDAHPNTSGYLQNAVTIGLHKTFD